MLSQGVSVSGGYISIIRLSPFNIPEPDRRYIVLKAYYDGGNKSHESGFLTLAGLAAPASVWPELERQWGEVLGRYDLKWWHTTDAMSPSAKRDFLGPEAAWDSARAEEVRAALGEVIGQSDRLWRLGFQILTCTVDLDDWRVAKERNALLRSAEAICVNVCVGNLLLDEDSLGELYFDHGEEFMKEVYQVWTRDLRKRKVQWTKQIVSIAAADSRRIYPLQAADLMAWNINAEVRGTTEKGIAGCRQVFGRTHIYYDLEKLEAEYPPEKERQRAEGIRRAARKTSETRALDEIERREREERA